MAGRNCMVQRRHPGPAEVCRGEEFRAKNMIDVFAGLAMHPAGWIERNVVNVRSGQERFKRMNGSQTTVFARAAGTHTPDRHGGSLVKGHDLILQDVDRIDRVLGGIYLRKTEPAVGIYHRLDRDDPDAREIVEVLYPAD
jgi:hypothetical protein